MPLEFMVCRLKVQAPNKFKSSAMSIPGTSCSLYPKPFQGCKLLWDVVG